MAFSSIGCSFLLARGFVSWRPPMQRRRNLENSAVPTLLARGSRLAFYATMWRAVSDLEARWNRILTIFDPYTFSHSQGHLETWRDPRSRGDFWSPAPPITDVPAAARQNGECVPTRDSCDAAKSLERAGTMHGGAPKHALAAGGDL